MNQIFSFKKEMKEPILKGIKYFTTREIKEPKEKFDKDENPIIPYRLKCGVGDIMYLYTGIRTKEAEKFGEAIVINTYQWEIKFPIKCPIGKLDWNDFSIAEGFYKLQELKDFFLKKLITYQFEVIGWN